MIRRDGHITKVSKRHITKVSKQYSQENIADYGTWKVHKLTLSEKEIEVLRVVFFNYLSTDICHKHSDNFQASVRNFVTLLNKGAQEEELFSEEVSEEDTACVAVSPH